MCRSNLLERDAMWFINVKLELSCLKSKSFFFLQSIHFPCTQILSCKTSNTISLEECLKNLSERFKFLQNSGCVKIAYVAYCFETGAVDIFIPLKVLQSPISNFYRRHVYDLYAHSSPDNGFKQYRQIESRQKAGSPSLIS